MASMESESAAKSFFCHQCHSTINPKLPNYTCPRCRSGCVEEMQGHSDDNEEQDLDSSTEMDAGRLMRPRQSHVRLNGASDYNMPEEGTRVIWGTTNHADTGIAGAQLFRYPGQGFNLDLEYTSVGDIIGQLMSQLSSADLGPSCQALIDALPTRTLSEDQTDAGGTVDCRCCVCMETLCRGETATPLPCSHLFHTDCIRPWLKLNGTCPICRQNLRGGARDPSDKPRGAESQISALRALVGLAGSRHEELNSSRRARVANAWTSNDESGDVITSSRPDQTLVYSRRGLAKRDEDEGGDVRRCLNDGRALGSSLHTLAVAADLHVEDLEAGGNDGGGDGNMC